MQHMTVKQIFEAANLKPQEPVCWKTRIKEKKGGVYVVSRTCDPNTLCIASPLPLGPIPNSLLIDINHEHNRWLASEPIVYIGKTHCSIGRGCAIVIVDSLPRGTGCRFLIAESDSRKHRR